MLVVGDEFDESANAQELRGGGKLCADELPLLVVLFESGSQREPANENESRAKHVM